MEGDTAEQRLPAGTTVEAQCCGCLGTRKKAELVPKRDDFVGAAEFVKEVVVNIFIFQESRDRGGPTVYPNGPWNRSSIGEISVARALSRVLFPAANITESERAVRWVGRDFD
jgi:hypothetical protein